MTAAKINLKIEQGSTWQDVTTWQDSDENPVDLTGYTARMQIRASVDASSTLDELTTENGGILLGGTAGTITLSLTATETAALSFTNAVYDLELINGSTVTRLMQGVVTLSKEVTR